MASHYFDDHDALMTRGRGVQSIQRVHHHADSGIESERHRRRFKIVVDCLWDADAVDASFLQLLRGDHRSVATHNDQRFYLKLIEDFFGVCNDVRGCKGTIAGADFSHEMAAICRADDRAAQCHDSINAFAIENNMIARGKKPFESVAETDHFPAEFFRGEHDSAQHGVESRAIATAGENANAWFHFITR